MKKNGNRQQTDMGNSVQVQVDECSSSEENKWKSSCHVDVDDVCEFVHA